MTGFAAPVVLPARPDRSSRGAASCEGIRRSWAALILLGAFVRRSSTTVVGPTPTRTTSWTMPFPPHWEIGGIFLTGIGALLLGLVLMIITWIVMPPFFRGEHCPSAPRSRWPTTSCPRSCGSEPVRRPVRSGLHVPRRAVLRPRRPGVVRRRARWWSSGAPFDGGTSHRPGARFGPMAIRMTDYLAHDGSRPSLALRTDGLRRPRGRRRRRRRDVLRRHRGRAARARGGGREGHPRRARSRSSSAATTRSPTPTRRGSPTCSATAASR